MASPLPLYPPPLYAKTIFTTGAEPDPRLGAPRAHRRVDRASARGHSSTDPSLQARTGAGARRGSDTTVAVSDFDDEIDLRAEDDALIAAELDAEAKPPRRGTEAEPDQDEDGDKPKRRRGRRGGRTTRAKRKAGGLWEATFDHGEEGIGLWLDPAVQDDPIYAEYWAGHRPVEVTIEEDQIVIRRAGAEESEDSQDSDD